MNINSNHRAALARLRRSGSLEFWAWSVIAGIRQVGQRKDSHRSDEAPLEPARIRVSAGEAQCGGVGRLVIE